MADEGIQGSCAFLKDPLSVSDLIGEGSQFDIKVDFDDGLAEDIFDELNLGSDDEGDNKIDTNHKNLISPWTRPFNELREQMTKIGDYIHKIVTIEANDTNKEKGLVPDGVRVAIRYSAYWEGEGAPFDSSFLRGTAFTFVTGKSEVLEGIEAAVRTMYVGESALFLISYQLLFRELGCPPRIKPRADGLLKIEVVKFTFVGELNAIDQLSKEERNKFSVLFDKIKQVHLKGLDFFNQSSYLSATRAFERAVDALNFCHLANEEEQNEQTKFLIKLYTNLAVCYIKINAPSKTCIMVREIKRLTNNKPSCKAIFQEGRALLMLGDYEGARDVLKRANRLEPSNATICDELRTLEERFQRYKKSEREIWTKAMGIVQQSENLDDIKAKKNSKNSPDDCNLDDDFKQVIDEMINDFKNNLHMDRLPLPESLGRAGIEYINELADSMDMILSTSHLNKDEHTLLKK